MLNQDPKHPFDRAQDSPVDDHWGFFLTVTVGVFQVKPLGQLEVELDCSLRSNKKIKNRVRGKKVEDPTRRGTVWCDLPMASFTIISILGP